MFVIGSGQPDTVSDPLIARGKNLVRMIDKNAFNIKNIVFEVGGTSKVIPWQ